MRRTTNEFSLHTQLVWDPTSVPCRMSKSRLSMLKTGGTVVFCRGADTVPQCLDSSHDRKKSFLPAILSCRLVLPHCRSNAPVNLFIVVLSLEGVTRSKIGSRVTATLAFISLKSVAIVMIPSHHFLKSNTYQTRHHQYKLGFGR